MRDAKGKALLDRIVSAFNAFTRRAEEHTMDLSEQKELETFKADAQSKLEMLKFVHQLRTEEFKSLRAEIEMLVKDARSLELYVLTGLVAYYAWLLTHCVPGATTLVPLTHAKLSLQLVPWLIPIALPILGAWRSWANLGRIMDIGAYITEIEGNLFADDRPLGPRKGWEHFVEKRRRERPIRQASHTIVWILLIGVTVVMALFGSELGVAACKPSVPV